MAFHFVLENSSEALFQPWEFILKEIHQIANPEVIRFLITFFAWNENELAIRIQVFYTFKEAPGDRWAVGKFDLDANFLS